MKQKLLLLSVVLAIAVSVAHGKDDSWWESQGYSSEQQEYYQTTERTRANQWALGIVPDNVVTSKLEANASSYTLDWTAYDNALTALSDILTQQKSLLPSDVYNSLEEEYTKATKLKKETERDWRSAAFSFPPAIIPIYPSEDADLVTGGFWTGYTRYYFVNRYAELAQAYVYAINDKTHELNAKVSEARAAVELATLRNQLSEKIKEAEAKKESLESEAAKTYLAGVIETANQMNQNADATAADLLHTISVLDTAIKTCDGVDDKERLELAIEEMTQEAEEIMNVDAKAILVTCIGKAQHMLETFESSQSPVTSDEVTAMISELNASLLEAEAYAQKDYMTALLANTTQYADLIPDEIAAAKEAVESTTMTPAEVINIAQKLFIAASNAASYTNAKNELQKVIDEAKLSEEPSADLLTAITNGETAVAAAFTQDLNTLNPIMHAMDDAYNALKSLLDSDRWSHQALTGKLAVQPWRSNAPTPNQVQYIKLVEKYSITDYEDANVAVDLFLTDMEGTAGSYKYKWSAFSADTDYKANSTSVSSTGVADLNDFSHFGWSYKEHYNTVFLSGSTIHAGDIISGGITAGIGTGPATISGTLMMNLNDVSIPGHVITNFDENGQYTGRYYTFNWSESNKGGVYRVPTELSIYDETGDVRKVKDVTTYLSQPSSDGTYFINSDLLLDGDKGYDNTETLFDFNNGTAMLKGKWHHVQFIDKNQFLFHQAAQKAADWYNNNPDLRQYDTKALEELKAAVETDGVDWDKQAARVAAAMDSVLNSYNKVNMLVGDSIYGVIATGDKADVERTYTVTGAPGDAIDAIIMAQTNDGWSKDDKQYWEITAADTEVGNDSTATIKVKFNPGTNYPADYREYRAVLDVKVGNLNYQNTGKDSLQQNLYGANPKLSLLENNLHQEHALKLHRKDSITYDLYARGYANSYKKTPLTANYFSIHGDLLATSEVKASFANNEVTADAASNDLAQTKFTVAYNPEDLGADTVVVAITDSIRDENIITLNVTAAKSQITFDPATVKDINENSIALGKMGDGTDAFFFPADGETYLFPIAISNFEGVNTNTEVVNKDGVISVVTEVKNDLTGLVVEHEKHDVQITIDNRDYYTVEPDGAYINGTGDNLFIITVKTRKLEQGQDNGQHNAQLQVIWQDQDTIKINLNQTLPWFAAPEAQTDPSVGPIVDVLGDNTIWRFTEAGDNVWYVDVKDVDNYYEFATNFKATTKTDWFIVNPSVTYQLTNEPGTRRYRLEIIYNPHKVNTVYEGVMTLSIYDSSRNAILATTSIKLHGDAVASIKGGATGVSNVEAQTGKKDGKYFKNGKIVIVRGGQEYNAAGAQMK